MNALGLLMVPFLQSAGELLQLIDGITRYRIVVQSVEEYVQPLFCVVNLRFEIRRSSSLDALHFRMEGVKYRFRMWWDV